MKPEFTDKTAEWKALIERLKSEYADDLVEVLERCQKEVRFICTHCGNRATGKTHCMARWCPCCQPLVTAERYARWGQIEKLVRWPLFLTLTIPNSEDPESLRRLKKKWSAFRRRKLIREKVAGGVATFEITQKGKGWHPHIHALCDSKWLSLYTREPNRGDSEEIKAELCRRAQEELSALWADQIGEPLGIVWARRAWGGILAETMKYAVKGSDLLKSPVPIAPMLRVIRQSRALAGWGSLFPLPSPDEEMKTKCSCSQCGETGTFLPVEVADMLTRSSVVHEAERRSYYPRQQ